MASFQIVKLNLNYIVHNESIDKTKGICEICKKSFCGKESICVGKCKHAFHEKCILSIYKISCPIDNVMWTDDYVIKK